MKKMLVIAIICIFIGGVLCGVAYAAGEKYVEAQLTDISKSFISENINKISINDYVAEIKLIKYGGENKEISVQAQNIIENEYKCEMINDTMKISYNPTMVKFGFISLPTGIFNWRNKTPVINIYIPENKKFDEVNFGGGVGKIQTDEINAQVMILAGGVGEYDINNISVGRLDINGGVGNIKINGEVNGDFKIDGGVGEIKIDAIINGNAKIDSGVGNIKIYGQINGNIKLKTGVGNTVLDLSGNAGDYNIKADKGVGNIRLNGNKIENVQNNGKYNIDIDAGVGDININIK